MNLDTKINKEEVEMHPINIMTKQGIVQNSRIIDIMTSINASKLRQTRKEEKTQNKLDAEEAINEIE